MRITDLSTKNIQLVKPPDSKLPDYSEIRNRIQNSQHSLLNRYKLRRQLASQRLKVAKRDKYGGLQPELNYSQNEEGDNFIGIGFTMELPVFGRNQAKIAKAAADVNLNHSTVAYLQSKNFEEEFKLLYDGALAKLEQSRLYEVKVIPALQSALKKSNDLLKNGQISLFELWSMQKDFHDAVNRASELSIESFQSNIELSLISGMILF